MAMGKNYFQKLFSKYAIKINNPGSSVNISVTGIGRRLDSAQDAMKEQLIQDMLQYVPIGDTKGLYGDVKTFNETSGERDVVYAYNPNGVPYGHYQHEGVLYVDPEYKKGAFYAEDYGYWSRPGVEKERTTQLLNYSSSNARRAWLRYAAEHDKEDVVKAAKEGFRK